MNPYKDEYATGASALVIILRAGMANNPGRKGVPAQYRAENIHPNAARDAWSGCTLTAVGGASSTIRIANGDTFNVPTYDVRIRLA